MNCLFYDESTQSVCTNTAVGKFFTCCKEHGYLLRDHKDFLNNYQADNDISGAVGLMSVGEFQYLNQII